MRVCVVRTCFWTSDSFCSTTTASELVGRTNVRAGVILQLNSGAQYPWSVTIVLGTFTARIARQCDSILQLFVDVCKEVELELASKRGQVAVRVVVPCGEHLLQELSFMGDSHVLPLTLNAFISDDGSYLVPGSESVDGLEWVLQLKHTVTR
jgi:hypothetical protein